MIMMGELNYFLGLQTKQLKEGIFINQAKSIKDLIKKFDMEDAKPMSTSTKLDSDERGKSVDIKFYRSTSSYPCRRALCKKNSEVHLLEFYNIKYI